MEINNTQTNQYSNQNQSACFIKRTTKLITIFGAILYSIAGIFNIHILDSIFGLNYETVKMAIYILIGICAIFTLYRKIVKWYFCSNEYTCVYNETKDSDHRNSSKNQQDKRF